MAIVTEEINAVDRRWLNKFVFGKDAPMQTIKSLIVVALLLTICFGAYKAMNAPDVEMPEDLKTWADQNGKDILPDFEIPAITSNDSFGGSGGESLVSIAKDNSLPQFPAIDLATNNAPANPGSASSQNSNTTSNPIELPKLPAVSSTLSAAPTLSSPTSVNGNQLNALTTNTLPNLNAQLGNNAASSPVTNAVGPAIPFNPGLPNSPSGSQIPSSSASLATGVTNSIANELIDAGSGALPLLASPTQTSSAVPGEPLTSLINAGSAETNSPSSASLDAATGPKSPQPTQPFPVARSEALRIANEGKLREALDLMSQYYESPDLDYAEHTDLVDILDALTREVIYSDRHLLTSPYTVSAQDTLQSLAAQYKLNPELLAAINKMGSSQALVPNSQIKVLEGPFHAQVSLSRGELTLFLRKLYAGRFPVSISQKNRPPQARYEVVDRRQDRTFYGANVRIPAGDPTNPYGGFWLSLGSDYSIHGSPEQVTSDLENAGCISLAPLDAADVYRILGKGSAVEIRP